jgi:hypothetical protein
MIGLHGTVGWEPPLIKQTTDKPSLFARQLFAFVAGFCIRVKREQSTAKDETKAG